MKFKCKSTNLIYNFEFEVDIASMMNHPDYECMDETTKEKEVDASAPVKPAKTHKKAKVTPDESSING